MLLLLLPPCPQILLERVFFEPCAARRSRAKPNCAGLPKRAFGNAEKSEWRPGGQERGVRHAARKRAVALAGHWVGAAFPDLAKLAGPDGFAGDLGRRGARPHR
jgi:hypothetical protein